MECLVSSAENGLDIELSKGETEAEALAGCVAGERKQGTLDFHRVLLFPLLKKRD